MLPGTSILDSVGGLASPTTKHTSEWQLSGTSIK